MAIVLPGKRGLSCASAACALCLFLAVPCDCLQSEIVAILFILTLRMDEAADM